MLKTFKNGAKLAAPILIVMLLMTIVKGYKNPMPEAEEILFKHASKISILTGFSSSQLQKSETYLLIDPDNLNSSVVVITKEKGELSVINKQGGLFIYFLTYIFLIALFWWSWYFPMKTNEKNT